MTTAQLTDYTVDLLGRCGVTLRRNAVNHRGRFKAGISSWPDLIGYDGFGRFWAVEIKNAATGDDFRGRQIEELRLMGKAGCEVHVVTSIEDAGNLMVRARRRPAC